MSHNQLDKKSQAWSALFAEPMSDLVKRYTSSVFFDKRLWQADIAGSLAHAEMLRDRRSGMAPILLLDEIAAHLDERRRAALFAEILHLCSQAWMTGTDPSAFSTLLNGAQFVPVDDAGVGSGSGVTLQQSIENQATN